MRWCPWYVRCSLGFGARLVVSLPAALRCVADGWRLDGWQDKGDLPGSVTLQGEPSNASADDNQRCPFESRESGEMMALIPASSNASNKGKRAVQIANPQARKLWKKSINRIITTNVFAKNVGYVERKGTVINDGGRSCQLCACLASACCPVSSSPAALCSGMCI